MRIECEDYIEYSELYFEEEEVREKIRKALIERYKKNETIGGYIQNMYDIVSSKTLEEPIFHTAWTRYYDETGKKNKRAVIVEKKDYDFYKGSSAFYDNLVHMHPTYVNRPISYINSTLIEKIKDYRFIPKFVAHEGFVIPYLRPIPSFLLPSGSNSKGSKGYLDVGEENFDELYMDILEFYCKYRKEIDRDLFDLSTTNTDECKMRTGYGNDAIVFRFCNQYQYEVFKMLLSREDKILSHLRMSNPFMPTDEINGHPIGVLYDNGGSYNMYVSTAVRCYVLECIENGKEVSLIDFLKYLKNNMTSIYKYEEEVSKQYGETIVNQIEKELTR